MFDRILVANRGEIACRVIATARRMGIETVAVYSTADRTSAHVRMADDAVLIGEAEVARSYLDSDAVLRAAVSSGAQAIHPGYGFLSEDSAFARATADAGLTFIGPTPRQLETFGDKAKAREAAARAGVPMLPGSGLLSDVDHALAEAERIGFPVIMKASGGGGGIGMRVVRGPVELRAAFDSVRRLAAEHFGNPAVFCERYVDQARHIEVQVVGDGEGRVVSLGDRDCSLQRRNQKVVEEAPAPALPATVRDRLHRSARALAESMNYASVGTVEFVYDARRERASFLEMNTRLQVEHGVTELVTDVDLVEWMIRIAAGDTAVLDGVPPEGPALTGHAIQARVYAEDPVRDHLPSAGTLSHVRLPDVPGVRVDTWIAEGQDVPPHYDPLLAKVMAHGADREEAISRLAGALARTRITGVHTNLGQLLAACDDPALRSATHTTATLPGVADTSPRIDVIEPGTLTTVQDWPGRLGFWEVGVPPSGPMDDLSFRLGNLALGNPEGAPGLECTLTGPTLRFAGATTVCVTGAEAPVTVDGKQVAQWEPVEVPAGGLLTVGTVTGAGVRAYVLFRGGLDVPRYLGSAATFPQGGIGGYTGRELRAGDTILPGVVRDDAADPRPVPARDRPRLTHDWTLAVLPGPQPAPDYFTVDDMAAIYAATWTVQVHAGRPGVRLSGPRPRWARDNGGEAGLHPSNLHDNAYSVGTVNFTGDTPALLGPDGPSLGGFACPMTVVSGDRWKLGQLRPDDRLRFHPVTEEAADAVRVPRAVNLPAARTDAAADTGVVLSIDQDDGRPAVVYRRAGDDAVLVEYGPMTLDLGLRMRIHALATALHARDERGIIDVTPGVRSLHIHTDPDVLGVRALTGLLAEIEGTLPSVDDMVVPSRELRLPLSWDDPSVAEAIERYTTNVRDDALYNPSNIEFIRRINGLATIEDVRRVVFEASYLVLGLGDVYLGAPAAVPIDPRHRLVTTKYNPARTWTAEGTVGIGGSYLCVYGMESPGGYQLIGRTVPIWSGVRQYGSFQEGVPWLLRFFDRIVWEPVSPEELADIRADLRTGRTTLDIREGTFDYAEYRKLLVGNAESIAVFTREQAEAFEAERRRWAAAGEFDRAGETVGFDAPGGLDIADGEVVVTAPMAASVWRTDVVAGSRVTSGEPLVTLEAMKLEMPVTAPVSGTVRQVLVAPGDQVAGGAPLLVVAEADEERVA
ncbi:urea carboxylase [Saccharomonospora amisosensis]|uniref:Urea carboxylase n=1 Tax=Saccharomonospora amisosensis TaxID=1128677 RepID=A0A7X5ZR89_9PSEU|nr:urea carboxylase [Saccharomonospora amisosensis]NIJ12582.1 urea carboxylase [Saccharomonospora amisosensis]